MKSTGSPDDYWYLATPSQLSAFIVDTIDQEACPVKLTPYFEAALADLGSYYSVELTKTELQEVKEALESVIQHIEAETKTSDVKYPRREQLLNTIRQYLSIIVGDLGRSSEQSENAV